jgi:hypothetical protein
MKSNGSEYATLPFGMVILDEPDEKVSGWRVPVNMYPTPAFQFPDMASEAAVMVKSEPPNMLEICIRILSEASDVSSVWRSVAFVRIALPDFCWKQPLTRSTT